MVAKVHLDASISKDRRGRKRAVERSIGVNSHFALWRTEKKAVMGPCDEPLLPSPVEPDCDMRQSRLVSLGHAFPHRNDDVVELLGRQEMIKADSFRIVNAGPFAMTHSEISPGETDQANALALVSAASSESP